jgi:hypothetical protein
MRSALLVVACACSRPQPPPTLGNWPGNVDDCDAGVWQQRAASQMRERLDDRDLIVVDACYGVSRVVAKLRAAIVATTISDRRLTRVVTRETPLWEAPGYPLPGIVVEPGVPVRGSGDWLNIEPRFGIAATGYVPARATGYLWTAQPPPSGSGQKLGRYARVVAEPTSWATPLADIMGSDPVFDQIDAGPDGWLHVTASDASIRVTGWVEPPPPPSPPSAQRHVYDVYDFSDDMIEGELVRPDGETVPRRPHAIGCIRARADDTSPVIGVVTGELTGTPEPGDWVRVELFTPWGHVTGHAHEHPQDR